MRRQSAHIHVFSFPFPSRVSPEKRLASFVQLCVVRFVASSCYAVLCTCLEEERGKKHKSSAHIMYLLFFRWLLLIPFASGWGFAAASVYGTSAWLWRLGLHRSVEIRKTLSTENLREGTAGLLRPPSKGVAGGGGEIIHQRPLDAAACTAGCFC